MDRSIYTSGPLMLLGLTLSMNMALATIAQSPVAETVINCTDVEAVAYSSCWDTLNLTQYLLNWEPPQCTTTGPDSGCCESSETWSSCFLRLATGNREWKCNEMSVNVHDCNSAAGWADRSLDPSIIAKATYVLRNIVGRFPFMRRGLILLYPSD